FTLGVKIDTSPAVASRSIQSRALSQLVIGEPEAPVRQKYSVSSSWSALIWSTSFSIFQLKSPAVSEKFWVGAQTKPALHTSASIGSRSGLPACEPWYCALSQVQPSVSAGSKPSSEQR